jgi:hypothetical protein
MADKSARAMAGMTLRRAYPAQFEIRAKSGSQVGIKGYATVYGQPYEMFDQLGSYVENVREGAGKRTLGQKPQVQLLLNHDGLPMAYTKAGTLRLAEDAHGLEGLEITTCLRRGEVEVVTRFAPAAAASYERFVETVRERHADTLFSEDGSTVDDHVAARDPGRPAGGY